MKHKLVNLSSNTDIVPALLIFKKFFPMDERVNGSLEMEFFTKLYGSQVTLGNKYLMVEWPVRVQNTERTEVLTP